MYSQLEKHHTILRNDNLRGSKILARYTGKTFFMRPSKTGGDL